MDIDVFTPNDLPTVMRTLRTALRVDGALDAREQLFLDTYARIAKTASPKRDPLPLHPDQVAIVGAHQRKRLVQLSALAVLHSRPLRADSIAFLKMLADRLDAHDPVIDVIDAIHQGRPLKARLLAMRRVMRVMLKEAYLAEGAMGVIRVFAAVWLKAPVNRNLMTKYKRLGMLPEGTLGREYWKFMVQEGFNFPGEPAGIPATISYHDIAHVLAGHEATPRGEIQQGSFQGGNRREDGFFFIQMAVVHFHQGVVVTPATPATVDLFDAEKVLWAIHRGASCNVDLTHQWNYWDLMPLSLDEARARIALLPKLHTTPPQRRDRAATRPAACRPCA
jgi:hypothetical protein